MIEFCLNRNSWILNLDYCYIKGIFLLHCVEEETKFVELLKIYPQQWQRFSFVEQQRQIRRRTKAVRFPSIENNFLNSKKATIFSTQGKTKLGRISTSIWQLWDKTNKTNNTKENDVRKSVSRRSSRREVDETMKKKGGVTWGQICW